LYSGNDFEPNVADEVIAAVADATPRTARRLIEIGFGLAAQNGRRSLTPADIAKARRHASPEPKHARFGFHPGCGVRERQVGGSFARRTGLHTW